MSQAPPMIVAIGNAPSSGSTYLADLLDSLPFGVCPPEMHLLSPRCHFEDFEAIRRHGFRRSPTPSCLATYSVRFATRELPLCGMDRRDVTALLREAETLPEFCMSFFRRYTAYRGKSARLFFEKTPENLHTAALFLETFPDSVFLHIVRDPLYVFRSLRRSRALPFSIAAATWLIDVAAAYALRDHPRFYTIHYEDLAQDAEAALSSFLSTVGEKLPETCLKDLYEANVYRPQARRNPRWGQAYGTMGNANEGEMDAEVERAARYMTGLRIGRRYARLFGLPEVSYGEVAQHYGYTLDAKSGRGETPEPTVDLASRLHMFKKWAKDVLTRSAEIHSLPAYLTPVERI